MDSKLVTCPQLSYSSCTSLLRALVIPILLGGTQRAVVPAQLPKGPSSFELRVWAIFTKTSVHILSSHRAKVRGCGSTHAQTRPATLIIDVSLAAHYCHLAFFLWRT